MRYSQIKSLLLQKKQRSIRTYRKMMKNQSFFQRCKEDVAKNCRKWFTLSTENSVERVERWSLNNEQDTIPLQ